MKKIIYTEVFDSIKRDLRNHYEVSISRHNIGDEEMKFFEIRDKDDRKLAPPSLAMWIVRHIENENVEIIYLPDIAISQEELRYMIADQAIGSLITNAFREDDARNG